MQLGYALFVSRILGSLSLAVLLSVLLNTRESISDLCFPAAVPRSVRDESPDTPPSQRASLVASPSSSESVTRCSALRLLLRGEYCLAASPPHSDLSSSSKLVAPSLTQAIGCRRDAVQICTRRTSPSALLKTCVLLKVHSNPLLCMVCHVATHRYPHGRVEPPCRIRRPHQHVGSRLPRIDPLKNSGNRLSFASSGSRSRFREGQGKQVPCVGLFRPLGVLRSYVLLACFCSLGMDAVCRSDRARLSRGCHFRANPRSASLARRSLLPHSRVSRLLCCWSVSALLFVIMLALTPASSTPAPCPRAPFATLVTSRRRVHDRRREALPSQGLPVRRLHLGSSCPSLHEV